MEMPMMKKKEDMKEGDDKERKPGRRLLQKERKGKMGDEGKDEMEPKDEDDEGFFSEMCSEEMGNNSLTDLFKGLLCTEEEDEEDEEDMDEDEKDKKDWGEKKGEMEEKKLYVMYDWQYLLKDGEKTDEEFCFKAEHKAPEMIKSAEDFADYCELMEKCGGICKSAKQKVSKEDKKKGIKPTTTCGPSKKVVKKGKVKCKKVGDLCDMFEGCKKSEKKGKVKCSGSANLE